MTLRPLIAIGLLAGATAAAAEPERLSGDAIKATLTGALLELDTPLGHKIPVRFSDDGLVSGEAGELASYLGAAKDRGRWWTTSDRLCVKWFKWFDAEARCLVLKLDGTRIFWKEQGGKSGTATLTERAKPVEKSTPPPSPPYALSAQQVAEDTTQQQSGQSETPPIRFVGAMMLATPSFAESSADAAARAGSPESIPAPSKPAVHERVAVADQAPVPPRPSAARRPPTPSAARSTARPRAPAAAATASFRVAGVDDDDVLNVRSGPSDAYDRVGGIPPEGRGVKIVGACLKDWCPIRHGRVSGWVNRAYLAEDVATQSRRTANAR